MCDLMSLSYTTALVPFILGAAAAAALFYHGRLPDLSMTGCPFFWNWHGKVTRVQADTCILYQIKYPSTGVPCTRK